MAIKRDQVIRSAEKYVGKGKIDAAIKEYNKVLAETPQDAKLLNRVGDLYVRLGRMDDAVRLFTQTAEQFDEDGFVPQAIAIYKKVQKLAPGRLPVYEKLAHLYHKQGLATEARTQYQILADYYLKHNDNAAAITVYLRMAELEPDNPSHQLKLAELYQQGRLWDKAMRSYRSIAELMLQHERVDEAVRVYQRAIEVHPDDIGFITDAVLGLKDGGHREAAERLLEIAVDLNPNAAKVARLAGLGPGASHEPPHEALEPVLPDLEELEEGGLFDLGAVEVEMGPDVRAEPAGRAEPEFRGEPAVVDEDAFLIDIDDGLPSSLVLPPEDMDSPGSAFGGPAALPVADEEELELDLDAAASLEVPGFEVEGAVAEPGAPVPSGASSERAASGRLDAESGDLGFEIELEEPEAIEWGLDEGQAAPSASPQVKETPAWAQAEPDHSVQAEHPAAPDRTLEPGGSLPGGSPVDAPRVADLVAEAEVFAKYGLGEKALERLEQVFAAEPENLAARELVVDVHLKAGHRDETLAAAETLRRLAAEGGADGHWQSVRHKLEAAGLQLPGEAAEPPPPAPSAQPQQDRVSKLLRALEGEPPPRPARKRLDIDATLAQLAAGVLERPVRAGRADAKAPAAAPAPPAAPSPAAAAPAAPAPPVEEPPTAPAGTASRDWQMDEDAFADELPDIKLPEERSDQPVLEDSGVEWLDEAAQAAAATAQDERLFDDEEDFFDLAAELEEELVQEEVRLGDEIVQQEEPSLEEIVEGFKRGVAENLSPEDYDTHYNLGIAYREMGLLDEAIGEFQLASKSPVHLVDCCSLLGLSFLEKGLPELAVKWYQRGLQAPGLSDETMLSLLYDMGNVYLTLGDEDSARRTFVELYGLNTQYRDVAGKLEGLGGGPT